MLHFISGLPRSGSTLLASILRQNPDFHASIESPVGQMVTNLAGGMSDNEAVRFLDDATRKRLLQSIFTAFYEKHPQNVIFDNNRRWCAQASMLRECFPTAKIICCVRDPAAIVDSLERLHHTHPLHLSGIIGYRANTTVFGRVSDYLGPEAVLGFAYNAMRGAFYSNRDMLLPVEYDALALYPAEMMERLHKALALPPFSYNFENIKNIPGTREFDAELCAPGLHDLKPKVALEERTSIVPPEILANLPKPFWRVKKEATKGG